MELKPIVRLVMVMAIALVAFGATCPSGQFANGISPLQCSVVPTSGATAIAPSPFPTCTALPPWMALVGLTNQCLSTSLPTPVPQPTCTALPGFYVDAITPQCHQAALPTGTTTPTPTPTITPTPSATSTPCPVGQFVNVVPPMGCLAVPTLTVIPTAVCTPDGNNDFLSGFNPPNCFYATKTPTATATPTATSTPCPAGQAVNVVPPMGCFVLPTITIVATPVPQPTCTAATGNVIDSILPACHLSPVPTLTYLPTPTATPTAGSLLIGQGAGASPLWKALTGGMTLDKDGNVVLVMTGASCSSTTPFMASMTSAGVGACMGTNTTPTFASATLTQAINANTTFLSISNTDTGSSATAKLSVGTDTVTVIMKANSAAAGQAAQFLTTAPGGYSFIQQSNTFLDLYTNSVQRLVIAGDGGIYTKNATGTTKGVDTINTLGYYKAGNSAVEGDLTVSGLLGAATSTAAATLLVQCTTMVNAGSFTTLSCVTDFITACTTAPAFNVRNNTAATTGTAKSCGTAAGQVTQAETLAFAAGDQICIVRTTNGGTCTLPSFAVAAHWKSP